MTRDFRWIWLLIFSGLYAFACGSTVLSGSAGGTTGTGGQGGGGSGQGNGGTAGSCPLGQQVCGFSNPCPQGQFCEFGDPCGDYPSCMDIPDACAAMPTCACLIANVDDIDCSGDAGAGFVTSFQGGDSCCCP
jgi:hypothetical protein